MTTFCGSPPPPRKYFATFSFASFIFDAISAVAVAIDSLRSSAAHAISLGGPTRRALLLEALLNCSFNGTTGEVRFKKSYAATSKPGSDGNAGNPNHGFLEVKWIRFVNDVGEKYLTFPPRGHGNELGLDAVDDLKEEVLLKGDRDGDGFEAHEIYKSDVSRRHDESGHWAEQNDPRLKKTDAALVVLQ